MTNSAAKVYGASALAAMGPVTKVLSVGALAVFGFLKGFQPVAGFSYGAGQLARLREAVRTAVLWSTVFCVLFGLTAALFAPQIMSLFTRGDAGMVRTGTAALRAGGLSFSLFGFYTVYSFLFLAMGRAQPAADVLSAAAAALIALRLRRELGASEASAPPRER